MVLGLRGSTLPQHRRAGVASLGACSRVILTQATLKHQPGELHRRESRYEPCEPSSSSSLADFGARVTLERLWSQPALSSAFHRPMLVTVDDRPRTQRNQDREKDPDYFANVGDAIRSLREDIPMLFQRELDYGIYREDIVFRDPRNCFKGMKNYQLIFWSLRFHGKLFFNKLYVDVKRIWQPEDGLIKMRWTVHGIPRVPWEAEGIFDGISTYRLDSHGKIYEHSVDNILLRDPPMATNPPLLAGLNLVPSQQPVPGVWCQGASPDEQWGSYVQRIVTSALQQWEQEGEQEPSMAAVAGMTVAHHQSHNHHNHHSGLMEGQQTAQGKAQGAQRGSGGTVSSRSSGGSSSASSSSSRREQAQA